MVNPSQIANSPSVISLSALLGGGALNLPTVSNQPGNFQEIISNLLGQQQGQDNTQLAVDASSNEKVKTALYQAASILYMMGDIRAIAGQDTAAISKDTVVSSIMQNNNLTPAERQLFLNSLKATAIAIVSGSTQAVNAQADPQDLSARLSAQDTAQQPLSNTLPSNISNTTPQSTPQVQTIARTFSLSGASFQVVPVSPAPLAPAAVATANTGNTAQQNTIQTPANLNVLPPAASAVVSNPVVVTAPAVTPVGSVVSTGLPQVGPTGPSQAGTADESQPVSAGPAQAGSSMAIAAANILSSGNSYSVNPAQLAGATDELDNLAMILRNILDNLISSYFEALNNVDNDGTDAKNINQAIIKLREKILQLKNELLLGPAGSLTDAQIAEAVNEIMSKLNAIVIAVDKLALAAVQVNGMPSTAAENSGDTITIDADSASDAIINQATSSNNSNQDSGSSNKYVITTGDNPPQFSDIVIKIVALLKSLNGQIQVGQTYEYSPRQSFDTMLQELNARYPFIIPAAEQAAAGVNAENIAQVIPVSAGPDNSIITASGQARLQAVPQASASVTLNALQALAASIVTEETAPSTAARVNNQQSEAAVTAATVTATAVSAALTPESVRLDTTQVMTGNPEARQDYTGRNLVRDVQWVSNNVITPAADSLEADRAAQDISGRLFNRVAEFARNIKDQIVLKQVISGIQNSNNLTKTDQITITLKPENLGYIYIKLEHKDGEIKGTIQVTSNDVKDILKANLPDLKQSLGNLGLTADKFDISLAPGNSGGSMDSQAQNQFKEWEGAALISANNIDADIDPYVNIDGYLNYLA